MKTAERDEDLLLKNTPAHSLEAERAVLGSVLLDHESLDVVLEHVQPSSFYSEKHVVIFGAMLDLKGKAGRVDVLTLAEHLKRTGHLENAGGPLELDRLLSSVPSSANAAYYARIVSEHALVRGLSNTLAQCLADTYGRTPPFEALAEAVERKVFERTQKRIRQETHTIGQQLAEAFARLYEPLNNVKYGISDLDAMTHGLHPGQLVLIAARPSMGKSTLGFNVLRNALLDYSRNEGAACAFFSLEMPASDVLLNMCCSLSKVDTHDVRGRRVTEEEVTRLEDASNKFHECASRFHLVDNCTATVGLIQATCRKLKREGKLDLVLVDYLQIVQPPEGTPKSKPRHEVVAEIAQGLKNTARELGVPVIAVAQLNREVEGRSEHKPRMSDLRESGAIEAVADTILLLHREAYYESDENKKAALENKASLIVAKNRNGPTGELNLYYDARFAFFGGLAG